MSKKSDSPISAEEIGDARPWRLPFWTEPPTHVVERETDDDASSANTSPPKTVPGYPTAEELELIRREAYNDGLEQGRVEGRQEGYKAGFEEGTEQGRDEGHSEGFKAGKQEGINAGFAEGRANGEKEVTEEASRLRAVVLALQASLRERDSQLPDVMILLITRLAEQILRHELSDGAQAIQAYVDEAIAALPDGEELARVYVAGEDAELLAPFSDKVKVHIDKALAPGDCRIESQTSLIEYATSEHFEQAILHLSQTLLTSADGYPSDDEIDVVMSEPESLSHDIEPDITSSAEAEIEITTDDEDATDVVADSASVEDIADFDTKVGSDTSEKPDDNEPNELKETLAKAEDGHEPESPLE